MWHMDATHGAEREAKGATMDTTTAQQVAALLDDDGQRWETRDGGVSLHDLATQNGARVTRRDGGDTRYDFCDGSAIVTCGGHGWDLALSPDCWCWQGAGHSEECTSLRALEAEDRAETAAAEARLAADLCHLALATQYETAGRTHTCEECGTEIECRTPATHPPCEAPGSVEPCGREIDRHTRECRAERA